MITRSHTHREGNIKMAFTLDSCLKIIPDFSGNRSELHKFLSCCEIVVNSTKPEDHPVFLNIVKTKLSGLAYNLIKYKTFASWTELKKCLLEQFSDSRSIAQLQSDLINARQSPKESVRAFGNRIERLLYELNDACILSEGIASKNLIGNLNEKIAFSSFVEGLVADLRIIIKASNFKTLSSAVDAAVNEERMQNSRSNQNKNSKPQNAFSNKTNNNSSNNNYQTSNCSYCNRKGHKTSDCFFKRANDSQNSSNYSSFPSKNILTTNQACAYCKKTGHHIRDCFKKKKADEFKAKFAPSSSSSAPSNSQYSGNGRREETTAAVTRVQNL